MLINFPLKQSILTIITVFFYIAFSATYSMFEGPMEATIAVQQVQDDNTTYIASQNIASGIIMHIMTSTTIFIILLIWYLYINNSLKQLIRQKTSIDK